MKQTCRTPIFKPVLSTRAEKPKTTQHNKTNENRTNLVLFNVLLYHVMLFYLWDTGTQRGCKHIGGGLCDIEKWANLLITWIPGKTVYAMNLRRKDFEMKSHCLLLRASYGSTRLNPLSRCYAAFINLRAVIAQQKNHFFLLPHIFVWGQKDIWRWLPREKAQ